MKIAALNYELLGNGPNKNALRLLGVVLIVVIIGIPHVVVINCWSKNKFALREYILQQLFMLGFLSV